MRWYGRWTNDNPFGVGFVFSANPFQVLVVLGRSNYRGHLCNASGCTNDAWVEPLAEGK